MKFQLIAGKHHQNGKSFEVGSIVESDKNLEALFGRTKFIRVEDLALPSIGKPFGLEEAKKLDQGAEDDKIVIIDKVDQEVEDDDDEEDVVEETEEVEDDASEDEDEDEAEEEEDDEEEEEEEQKLEFPPECLTMAHRGRGKYVVIDARSDKKIHRGTLSKAEATKLAANGR